MFSPCPAASAATPCLLSYGFSLLLVARNGTHPGVLRLLQADACTTNLVFYGVIANIPLACILTAAGARGMIRNQDIYKFTPYHEDEDE
jgi:hypothetical protein